MGLLDFTMLALTKRRNVYLLGALCALVVLIFSYGAYNDMLDDWQAKAYGVVKPSKPTTGKGESIVAPVPTHTVPAFEVIEFLSTTSSPTPVPQATQVVNRPEECVNAPPTDDILVIMKTGATEAYDKLPIHFSTTLQCINDTFYVSDMEMNMAGHHIVDVLQGLSPEVTNDNEDFKLYKTILEYHKFKEDPQNLNTGRDGWNLDKYKFIQMLLQTWKYRQDADWYMFMEADTLVLWDSLRTLLSNYNPKEAWYMGSPTYFNNQEFGHGGTGYVISGAAMRQAIGEHPEIAELDKTTKNICCGDYWVGKIMSNNNIKMNKVWPLFNGEKPHTLPFGRDQWCQPVITMHHITPREISQMWTFDQRRKASGIKEPMLFMDVYNEFVKGTLETQRKDWDNLSGHKKFEESETDAEVLSKWSAVQKEAGKSQANCERACSDDQECMQWKYKRGTCSIHHAFSLGGSSKKTGDEQLTSGWNLTRIDAFITSQNNCPLGPDWTVRGLS